MRHLLIPLFVAGALVVSGAQAPEPVDGSMVAKIRAEGLERSQVAAMFDHLTDTIGPRLTGSPAHRAAADWARDRLAALGLRNARLEPFEFGRGWQLDRFVVEMIEPRYLPLVGYPDAWSPSTSGEIVAGPVLVAGRSIDEVRRDATKLKGAIVLSQPLMDGFVREDRPQPSLGPERPATAQPVPTPAAPRPSGPSARDWLALYHEAGAGVLLKPSRGEHGTMFVLGRDAGDQAVPSVVLMAEQYNMIVRLVERGVPVRLRVNVQTRFLAADTASYNVLAELPGTDPALGDEVVMLGAHLDSWHTATGGTDNADGSAVALEAMRILTAIGARPRRTIRVALWSGEEQGLLGSRAWVDKNLAGDANRAARDRFSAYFNIDNGYGPIYGFYAENDAGARRIFDTWLRPFVDLGARRNVIEGIGSTDHVSFIRAGVAGFNPIQEYTDYDVRTHHTNADTSERVDPETLKQAAVVFASFIWHAAQRDGRLTRN